MWAVMGGVCDSWLVMSGVCDCGLVMEVLSGFVWEGLWGEYVGIQNMWTILGDKNSIHDGQFWASDTQTDDTLLLFYSIDSSGVYS